MLAVDTIEIFEDFTKFNLTQYFNDFIVFTEGDFQKLQNFYLGTEEEKNQISQNTLDNLYKRGVELDTVCQLNIKNFTRGDFVELMYQIDEIFYSLKKMNIMSKFLKSSITEKSKSSTILTDRVVSDFETPDIVAETETPDWPDAWVDIYIKNRKLETDFEANDGYYLQLNKSIFTNFELESVVDNLQGERLYGKDIYKELDYIDNDLITLDGIDTLHQSVETLANLQKRDIPQFPSLGLDRSLTQGSYEINLPLIIRDKQKDFSTDDTMLGFSIKSIEKKEGRLNMEFEVISFFSTVSKSILQL